MCEFRDRTENSGMMYIGGVNCNAALTGVKQGLLIVSGAGNALAMIGPANGFQLHY